MIYQCYFSTKQEQRLFGSPLYAPFGLEPAVNPGIARNCPELESAQNRLTLCEYAAMLHLHRNPIDDGDDWIGFTSYRQLDKKTYILPGKARPRIEELLRQHDVLGWGFFDLGKTIARQAEEDRPGIHAYVERLMARFGHAMPEAYAIHTRGLFCSYWLMPRRLFAQWMEWSLPMTQWALEHPEDAYARSHPKAVGYAVERLFVLWYMSHPVRLHDLEPLMKKLDRWRRFAWYFHKAQRVR